MADGLEVRTPLEAVSTAVQDDRFVWHPNMLEADTALTAAGPDPYTRDREGKFAEKPDGGMPDTIVDIAVKVAGGTLDISAQHDSQGEATISHAGRSAQLNSREIEEFRKATVNAEYGDEESVDGYGLYAVRRFESAEDGGIRQVPLVALRPVPGKFVTESGKRITDINDRPEDEEVYNAEFDLFIGRADSDPDGGFGSDTEPGLRVSLKDVDTRNRRGIYQTLDNVTAARRVEGDTGPVDVFTPRPGAVGLRMNDSDGNPAEVLFNARDSRRIDAAMSSVVYGDGDDDLDEREHAATRVVDTAAGPVEVSFSGRRENGAYTDDSQLTITPQYEAPWMVFASGQRIEDLSDAFESVLGAATLVSAARPAVDAFHLPGKHDQEAHGREHAGSALADILDDVALDVLGGQLYLGLREDGTIDLGAGDDDPVGRITVRDVDQVVDAMYAMWRKRGDDPADDNALIGLIDETVVETSRDRIYLAISTKEVDQEGGDEAELDDQPILTLGVPTERDTADHPDFHEIDLDEDDLSTVVSHLWRFRDDYEPAEVDSESLSPSYDIALLADHTIRLSDTGEFDDDAPMLPVGQAPTLAAAIRELMAVELPDQPGTPDDPDVVDGNDISDQVDVSVLEDGSFIVGLTSIEGGYWPIRLSREEAGELAEVLDRYVALDTGEQVPTTAAAGLVLATTRLPGRLRQREATTTMGAGRLDALTAAAEVHTGAMVALIPSPEHAARLAVEGGEPVDQLHCTLMYLGTAADIPDDAQVAIVNAVRSYVDGWPPVQADGFAVSLFNPGEANDRETCIVLGLSGEDLDIVHEVVEEAVDEAAGSAGLTLPDQHAPWVPHTTLVYTDDAGRLAALADRVGPVTFDRVRVAFAGTNVDIPLDGTMPSGADVEAAMASLGEFQSRMPAQLQRYWIRRLAPWGKGSFDRCVRQIRPHFPKDPEGTCANLHKTATGRWPNEKKDHAAASEEDTLMASPTMPVPEQMPVGDCPPGEHRMPDSGECMPDEQMAAETPPEHFHTIVMEGVSTGQRTFAAESITWRDPPFAFHWQHKSSAHGGTPEVVQVGIVTRAQREGANVHFWGRLDLRSPEALDYARRLVDGFAVWSSVSPDEATKGSNIELVYPDVEGDGDPVAALFGEPEEVIFHEFRVAEITAVSVPALADAKVEPLPALIDALTELGVLTAAAVASHDSGTSEGEWDASANVKRLPDDASVATLRKVFAWLPTDGEATRSAARYPHHEVSADGTPGAANLTACSAGIAALHGARGGTTIPDADRRGVYDHLAAHLRSADRQPPDFDAGPLVAAGYTITIPDVPPAWWFDEPIDVTALGALTVTDEGRIYGWVAPANVAHRSFPNRRVTAPLERIDLSRWMKGETIVASGGRVVTGSLTMDCGHLHPSASSDPQVRMDHYDNACSVVATAATGIRPGAGQWFAGALVPGLSANQLVRLQSCTLSGDWPPHPERPGWREFVAALVVPVPGFPMARSAPSVRVAGGALVASAVPVRLAHAGADTLPGTDLRPALERLARSIGRDADSRWAVLRERVHPDGR